MDAIILAGGLGTRLRETIGSIPKPLAPINQTPFLKILLDFIGRCALIDRVILATGYRAEAIDDFCNTYTFPFVLTTSKESAPLGTGGATKLAFNQVRSSEVLVLNGDSFFDLSLEALIHYHLTHRPIMTLAIAHVEETSRYGSVTLQGSHIVQFQEKSHSQGPGWINGGIYVMSRTLPFPDLEVFSLEKDLFPAMLPRGVLGYCSRSSFIDIGTKQSYQQAQGVWS